MSRTFSGTDTSLTMSCWFIWQWEFTQISTNHIKLDFNRVEDFTVVDTDDISNHLWHNDTVSQMSLDSGWLFSRLTLFLWFFTFHVESVVSVFDFSGESSSLSGSEQFNDLFSGKLIDLLWSVSSERILLKSLLFLLDGCH